MTKQIRIFNLLSEIITKMTPIFNLDHSITFFVSNMAKIFQAERVSFMLLDRTKQELSLKASSGVNAPPEKTRIKLGQMFGGWVAQQGRPLLVKDVESEYPDLSQDRLLRYKT